MWVSYEENILNLEWYNKVRSWWSLLMLQKLARSKDSEINRWKARLIEYLRAGIFMLGDRAISKRYYRLQWFIKIESSRG